MNKHRKIPALDPFSAIIIFSGFGVFKIIDIFYVQPLLQSKMNHTHRYVLAYILLVVSFLTFGYFLISENNRPFDGYSFLSYAFSLVTFLTSMIQFSAIKSCEKTKKMNKEQIIKEIETELSIEFNTNAKTFIRQLLDNEQISINSIAILICDEVVISRTENKNKIIQILAKYN